MRYLVLRKPDPEVVNAFTEMVGARDSGDLDLPFAVERPGELSPREVDDVLADPDVDAVVPSIPCSLIEPLETAADAGTPPMWGLDAVGATKSPFDGRGVSVAVLDTGIDRDHEAFKGLLFSATNMMDFIADEAGRAGEASDQHGHGTHVAATIFGRPVNGQRVGVAPGIERVLIAKVLGPNGGPTEAIFNAIEWAVRQRADIMSMSLGINLGATVKALVADDFPPEIAASRALEAYRANLRFFDALGKSVEVRRQSGRGGLLIAASGNESQRQLDTRFTVAVAPPAAADGFVSVGAVGRTNDAAKPFEVARFSNTGCSLAGPGVAILSAQRGGGLVAKDGTSMATPHVAGVAALWTQKLFPAPTQRPQGWAADVQRRLESTVLTPPGLARRDIGLGIVQAPQA